MFQIIQENDSPKGKRENKEGQISPALHSIVCVNHLQKKSLVLFF